MEGGGGKRKEVKIEHGSNEIINSTNFFESFFFLFVYVLLVCLYFFCVCLWICCFFTFLFEILQQRGKEEAKVRKAGGEAIQ